MSVPISFCPNCGTAWPAELRFCPLCGAMRPLVKVWPPAIATLAAPPIPTTDSLKLTGRSGLDVAAGVGICFAPWPVMTVLAALFGRSAYETVVLLAPPALYFVLRPRYPYVARGLGYGLLISLILTPILLVVFAVLLFLGLLALCSQNSH